MEFYETESLISLKESDFNCKQNEFNQKYFDDSKPFHIRLLESLSNSEIILNHHYVFLKSHDVILISSSQLVEIESLNSPIKLAVFSEELRAPSPMNLVVVGDNPMVHDLMNGGEETPRFIVYRNQNDKIKQRYFQLLGEIENGDENDPFLQFQREMIVGLILTELLRNHRRSISVADSFFPNRDIRHASKDTQTGIIFNYIVAHSKTATLSSTAIYFGYEKNYFSRLCRQLFDKSFTDQLAEIRIELAKRMLSLSSKSVEEISYELGYKNLSSFFAVFKRTCKVTPKEYRGKHGFAENNSPHGNIS